MLTTTSPLGVPISTQWDKAGYYYSTQISQFALSHWSKAVRLREWEEEEKDSFDSFLEDSEKVNRRRRRKKNLGGSARLVLEDGADHQGDWRGDVTRVTSLGCVHFDSASPILLDLDHLVRFFAVIIITILSEHPYRYCTTHSSPV